MASGEIDLIPGRVLGEIQRVTHAKINDLGLPVLRIKQSGITGRELGDNSISEEKLDSTITEALGVPDNSITTAKFVDGAVTKEKCAPGAVTDAMPLGSIIQFWGPATKTDSGGTGALMPFNRLPVWNEGAAIFEITGVTLRYPTSKVVLRLSTIVSISAANALAVAAVFRDQVNPCLYTRLCQGGNQANVAFPVKFEFIDTPGGVGPFIYTVRMGPSTATMPFLHSTARNDYGTLTIYEIKN